MSNLIGLEERGSTVPRQYKSRPVMTPLERLAYRRQQKEELAKLDGKISIPELLKRIPRRKDAETID